MTFRTITKTRHRSADVAARVLAINCVRNTVLEDIHKGVWPSSMSGDYTDVKVVTPYGEIPWNEISHIDDEQMKTFMKEVVDKLYTFLAVDGLLGAFEEYPMVDDWRGWDEAKVDRDVERLVDIWIEEFAEQRRAAGLPIRLSAAERASAPMTSAATLLGLPDGRIGAGRKGGGKT